MLNQEDVVISGISGRFPESDDIKQFLYNLENKKLMTNDDNRRWDINHPEIPRHSGNVNHVSKFDAGFFGIHQRQANTMDALCRMLLERTVEAIMDAGVNPCELEGSRTGVFVGLTYSETEKCMLYDMPRDNCFTMTGNLKNINAHRISYWLKLKGPSYVIDTACSSSLYAVEHAYHGIRSGKCEAAIVAGANLCFQPFLNIQFKRLGVLSPDGHCKTFDEEADGYVRSEAIVAIFLQKAKHSRRIYSTIIHAKSNCDGYKPEAITFPSSSAQTMLLKELYTECNIDPSTLSFLEAHGTGTKVGDPEEMKAVDEVFCKDRETPLLIGSVKSNMGHSEAAAGLCSIAKVLVSMESGHIVPNINYKKPKSSISALTEGRCVVVTENTPWKDDRGLAGVSSFGFGGANCHVLLKWNVKVKENGGLPKDDIPRLVCVSGRTKEAVKVLLERVNTEKLDVEYVRLLHEIFSKNIPGHLYRGFTIISKTGEWTSDIKRNVQTGRPFYVFLTDPGAQWKLLDTSLQRLPSFETTFQRIHTILQSRKVDLLDMVQQYQQGHSKSAFMNFLINSVVQIAIVDTLKLLGVSPTAYIGFSTGAIISAYAENSLSLERTVMLIYSFASRLDARESSEHEVPPPTKLHEDLLEESKGLELLPSLEISKMALSKHSVVLQIGSGDTRTIFKDLLVIRVAEEELTVASVLDVLGRIYEEGYSFRIHPLYPDVAFPVSRGTAMIAPFIKWNHMEDWFTAFYKDEIHANDDCRSFTVSTKQPELSFVSGHVIDGRTLFPATGYLYLVWKTLSTMYRTELSDKTVVFEEVKFHRATTVSEQQKEFFVIIKRNGRRFAVVESEVVIVSGRVWLTEQIVQIPTQQEPDCDLTVDENDIYKELKLRGYNYSGLFRGLKKCSEDATRGLLEWKGNWIAFMDNMLQMQLLSVDSRNLYVPTGIKRLVIDAKGHISHAQTFGEEPLVPVFVSKEAAMVRSGGIEIFGIKASAIPRRKTLAEPVLEKYIFVPNEVTLALRTSLRIITQIILENNYNIRFKGMELIDESTNEEPVSPLILEAFADLPLIQPEFAVLKDSGQLAVEESADIIVGMNLFQKPFTLEKALNALNSKGFILSREPLHFKQETAENYEILVTHTITDTEKLMLMRKPIQRRHHEKTIHITNDYTEFEWLETLQAALKQSEHVLLYTHNDTSGIMGLTNCLRMEAREHNVRCVFIMDRAPQFHPEDPFYQKQLSKGLAVNVFKCGQWGTFRHVPIQNEISVETEHCFARTTVRGDLSSVKWTEGPLSNKKQRPTNTQEQLVKVHYASLNFKDIMLASGRISGDVYTKDRTQQYCLQGLEYAGVDNRGHRVMGIIPSGALASLVLADPLLMIPVPKEWTLEDAATVPVVYGTVLYAFFMRGQLKRGQSILIHSGSGGVGQAAINIALHVGCDVFTTVGSLEKREFLKRTFPRLKDSNIGNSRDTSFEQIIMKGTKGRGVDVVLNSLAEEKLQTSIRCLAKGGTFLEIGKFDLESDNELFLKDFSFHGIMLDSCMANDLFKKQLMDVIAKYIREGAVKPLVRTIFEKDELEKSFRYMASGKHIGKVLIRMRSEEDICLFKGVPMYHCDPEGSYVITGGLGGFGLELANWLVLRGARKLILTSRYGLKNGYQSMRIRTWRSYGAIVEIATDDIKTQGGCRQIISKAASLGPVRALFHLAVVLQDANILNQTANSFRTSLEPKAIAVHNFDEVTRKCCPQLRDFVVFSSVSCGRGNGGQTNYGMANSIMERICERRKKDGFPGLAIQWGAIGDVGLVAEMQQGHKELNIGGTLQQRINSCLEVLDVFLKQSEPVVSSMVVAEKNASGAADNVVDYVASIIGIRDLKTISFQSTLAELGMDSMMAVEMKQMLEGEFGVYLSAQDMRNLTFGRLQELQDEIDVSKTKGKSLGEPVKGLRFQLLSEIVEEKLPEERLVRLSSLVEKETEAPKVFALPGIDGRAASLEPLAKNLPGHIFCFQYISEAARDTIEEMARSIFEILRGITTPKEEFFILAHSFGCAIASELLVILANNGYNKGRVVFIDGAPEYLIRAAQIPLDVNSIEFELAVVVILMRILLTEEEVMKHKDLLLNCKSFDERIDVALEVTNSHSNLSRDYQKSFATAFYKKIKAMITYKPPYETLEIPISLFKPEQVRLEGIADDYNLSKLTKKDVEIKYFKGDHFTILVDPELPEAICAAFGLKRETVI